MVSSSRYRGDADENATSNLLLPMYGSLRFPMMLTCVCSPVTHVNKPIVDVRLRPQCGIDTVVEARYLNAGNSHVVAVIPWFLVQFIACNARQFFVQ